MALSTILLSLAVLFIQLQIGSSAQVSPPQRLSKRGPQHSLQKRGEFSGRATFYVTGLGSCGQTNGPNDPIVALNAEQYDAGQWCGKKIKISFGGKSITATVQDRCVGCPFGSIDLSPSVFKTFAAEDVGVLYLKWSPTDGNSDQPATASKTAPPPKNEDQTSPKPAPPPKNEDQTPPKKEDPPPPQKTDSPQKTDPPPKDDPHPAYKSDNPPQYTPPTPSTLNPVAAFQSGSNRPTGSNLSSSLLSSQRKPIPTIPLSTGTTTTGGTPTNTNPNTLQPTVQINPYSPGGNLDAINQLVISFGALTAASAGNALNE